jgi:hypothetical protein
MGQQDFGSGVRDLQRFQPQSRDCPQRDLIPLFKKSAPLTPGVGLTAGASCADMSLEIRRLSPS